MNISVAMWFDAIFALYLAARNHYYLCYADLMVISERLYATLRIALA